MPPKDKLIEEMKLSDTDIRIAYENRCYGDIITAVEKDMLRIVKKAITSSNKQIENEENKPLTSKELREILGYYYNNLPSNDAEMIKEARDTYLKFKRIHKNCISKSQRDDIFEEIDKLVQFPKTRKEGIKRNKEFDNLYKKLFSEFDLESHPVYSYDEVRFRRAIVFGYKKALDKIKQKFKEHLKQKHKEE